MNPKFFVIIADQIDNTQRTQIQQVVKENAESWWHEFLDAWIVQGGHSASYWRDLLKTIITPGSGIMVLTLANRGGWAAKMPGSASWLREVYRADINRTSQ